MRTVCRAGLFLITGKSQILCLFIKNVTSNFNYQPFSLLPVCGKIFERNFQPYFWISRKKIVFSVQINLVFVHLTHVKTFYYQSFMTFMYYANFDQHPTLEMRANFLNILKAFDEVWHEGWGITIWTWAHWNFRKSSKPT